MGNNPLNYTDPSGNILESAIHAGDRATSLTGAFKPVADGIGCIFGSIGAALHALNVAQADGQTVVDVNVDLNACGAEVISKTAPLFSDAPVENTIKSVAINVGQKVTVKFLKNALPKQALSTTVSPTATPAYPNSWRGR